VTLLIVMLLGLVLLLMVAGLYNQETILRDWQMILAPWGERAYRELEKRAEGEAHLADYAYERARAAADPAEAVRLLEVGLKVIQHSSRDWVIVLRGMGVLSRMAGAIAPVEPVRPAAFRASHLWGLATLARLGHHLLVTTAERFRLRAYVLRGGFAIATRLFVQSLARTRARGAAAEPEWERLAAIRDDLRVLPAESLRTFHWLLVSLAAERRRTA